jgi:anti-sigma regulatory factor (Ser/Thr protein kinase)
MAASVNASAGRAVVPHPAPSASAIVDAVHHLERAEVILRRRDPVPTDVLSDLVALRERLVRGAAEQGRPPTATAGPTLVRQSELPVSTTAPKLARAFCRETCDEWALPVQVVSTATDLASELVANAVRHTRSPMRLMLERNPQALVLSVWDDGVGVPHVLPYRPGISERGIGLRLVKQLSTDWGWARSDGGKWVWARLAIPTGE